MKSTRVERISLAEGTLLPSPRTYHASCLVDKYMVVSGGEANNTDMTDMWALDIEECRWHQLEISDVSCFQAKRFHSLSAMSENRVVTFGGCHSEYVHLNDVNVFYLNDFVKSDGKTPQVKCVKLDFRGDSALPNTRWGHSAAVHEDRIYILGGRNEQDIGDLHCLDLNRKKWCEIDLKHQLPKPRRRHSAVFISSSLVMFGGFDGEFYNDMHILHLKEAPKMRGFNSSSTINSDYSKLVDSQDHSNIQFVLDPMEPDGM